MQLERPLPCPDFQTLEAYCVGRLPPEQTQSIADHIDTCDLCEQALLSLSGDDTFVLALRQHAGTHGPQALELGQRIGPYELVARIGQGAMGVVYKARHVGVLNRVVALKIALIGGMLGPQVRARFATEAEAVARLKHPNVVTVYDCGEQAGCPYFAMELIEGQSLARKIGGRPLPPREAAKLARTLAQTVAYAHGQGVLHRDLKPANVLLTPDGVVKLTDFGLAKLLDVDAGHTQPETVLGTASYSAPEQARGEKVGPSADVYSLGAVLYEMLTGRPPFKADSRAETLRLVISDDPVRPTTLDARLCRSLEAVCLKCLEKTPAKRYASAAALADDLGLWLEGRSTQARPLGVAARTWKAARRRPAVAACVLLLMLAGVAAAGWWALRPLSDEERYTRRVAPALAVLDKGEAVELIRVGGDAPPHRVRCGEGLTKARMTDEGFVVASPILGIVEFLPKVPASRYRILAEIRHDRTSFAPVGNHGYGLTFSHRRAASPDGEQHVLGLVGLNDFDRSFKPDSCRAILQLAWYLDTPTDGKQPFKRNFLYPPHSTAWYPSLKVNESRWNTIVIDVEPEKVTAYVGDPAGQKMGPLLHKYFERFAERLHENAPETRGAELAPLRRPVVGVVVSGAQCVVRRLRVLPLPEES